MLKTCSNCGGIHPYNFKCVGKRLFKKVYKEAVLRTNSRNVKLSKFVRKEANYMCAVCKDQGVINKTPVEMHHIEKLKDRPDLAFDIDNVICLCKLHHLMADNGVLDKNYLKSLKSPPLECA